MLKINSRLTKLHFTTRKIHVNFNQLRRYFQDDRTHNVTIIAKCLFQVLYGSWKRVIETYSMSIDPYICSSLLSSTYHMCQRSNKLLSKEIHGEYEVRFVQSNVMRHSAAVYLRKIDYNRFYLVSFFIKMRKK